MSEIKKLVSLTSLFMAAGRAIENEREDRLFEDPFARQLAGEETFELLKRDKDIVTNTKKNSHYIPVRTRFFDDFIINSVSQCHQIVILGAGMDTRAFRLNLPENSHIYEIDQAEVLEHKNAILKDISPKSHRHTIKADLRFPWIHLLLESGYCQDQPSIWLLEGLLYYLTEMEVYQLLKNISDVSAINSYLGADLVNKKSLEGDSKVMKTWRSGFDEPEVLFNDYGWTVSVVEPGDEKAHFGRYIDKNPPRNILNIPRVFLATGRKYKP
ncbi:SAM-dependent methyltransferase [Aphanothece sacrum]|uniref:S-adenosyl-L-methionine-dependent methyltransferase n=1 Tax=Aphanothece sacrum FPU1 TaxID=1920663 RepID=A0A401ICS7_APHSA|nr:SAM-dependent methyltransferase [Aphanothece sacrum]GBF78989.1 hypothetical protein AsFPU1_0381 [Aphanothece sacrum FPU1]GBF86663.1 hypothetical protein AsFPU3_3735 [Aphanothece sacrum FPU3]